MLARLKARIREEAWRVPAPLRRIVRRIYRRPEMLRERARWGNLRRAEPFSDVYGLDRGASIDRPLIERFLRVHADAIRGVVLEVRDTTYAQLIGGDRLVRAEAVDIDPANESATILADLMEMGSLPPEEFDCVILTQTLQFLCDPQAALRNVWAALRPGGTLLVTVPVTSRLDPTAGVGGDYWRFTPAGLEQLLKTATDGNLTVVGLGGLVVNVGFLLGLSAREVALDLDHDDERFPLIACASVRKAA